MILRHKIESYDTGVTDDEHHRYRSWEHCFSFFQRTGREGLLEVVDTAALQLGFYLASWGMYRGSSFLLQRTYTVHRNVVESLAEPRFHVLWEREITGGPQDSLVAPVIVDLVSSIRTAYQPYGAATDTLVSKVVLGTLGCLPACDRFFVDGFKRSGFSFSSLNRPFLDRILGFSAEHQLELRDCQTRIEQQRSIRYPLMKLVDMYFWQIGYEAAP